MTLHTCPVCEGHQSVPVGFYDGMTAVVNAGDTEPCRTCDGRGAVAVESLPVVVPSCWTREPQEPGVVTFSRHGADPQTFSAHGAAPAAPWAFP